MMQLKALLLPMLIFTITTCTAGEGDEKKKLQGVDTKAIDASVEPCENIWQYANGTWIAENPIPESESAWSNFNVVAKRNDEILKGILLKCSANISAEEGSNIQKIRDLYNTAMDSIGRNKAGFEPIKPEIDAIMAIKTSDDLIKHLARMHSYSIGAIFDYGVGQDAKINDKNISYLGQGSLGLPDRDYYLKKDATTDQLQDAYKKFLTTAFMLLKMDKRQAEAATTVMMTIETQMAEAACTRVEKRDPEKMYNKMTYSDMTSRYGNFNWKGYFETVGVKFDTIIIDQPNYMARMNSMIVDVSINDWKTYLIGKLVSSYGDKLSDEFEANDFKFYGQTLRGQPQNKPRWERALSSINWGIGEALGEEYVKIAFSDETKVRLDQVVDNLMATYKERILAVDWMSDVTKQLALKKLSTFTRKLAYPDNWKDYTGLTIKQDSYYANCVRVRTFEYKEMIDKLNMPIDKTEWGMPPQIVNAYYNPLFNEIVFPAGILQPPFLDPNADDALIYGTMGAVIGHEVTHGFDDQGSKFDSEGKMLNWWTDEDLSKFNTRADALVHQFDGYEALDSLYVNGRLTLGENIADLGGLTIAYHAYMRSLEGKERVDIDGYTPEQRFFIGFAQVWKGSMRDEALAQLVKTNPHAPAKFRVLGTLSNMPEFYEAFGCKPSDKMVRDEDVRVKIW